MLDEAKFKIGNITLFETRLTFVVIAEIIVLVFIFKYFEYDWLRADLYKAKLSFAPIA